ncbi:MAG: radical SAM protein, partial [Planctomycetales bacterium]|nr:radical SAM protein [Planctomycetales bacterium]
MPAKIIDRDNRIYFQKRCESHGVREDFVCSDANWFDRIDYSLPGKMPDTYGADFDRGCPYDCGLCPDHEQHSCLTLVEVGDGCNLSCPVCYAESGPHRMRWHALEKVERMLDAVVANEGEPDVVQISGGEPTIHPEFFAILDAAKRRPIRHLMVNTNGVRIARDPAFAERLAGYGPGFEVYLQFDSF